MSRLLITRAATVLNNRPTNLLHRPFFGGVKKMLGLQTEADKRKERINTEIDKFTENAPLFVKGLAMMVKPIINKVASSMHAAQERSDAMLADARYMLISSREVTDLIGTQISTGEPLSMQQSHVERNNGEGMERKMAISMTFQVTGERGQGLATLKSANGEIMELSVKVNNRTIHVSLGSRLGDDDVYEAEFRPKN